MITALNFPSANENLIKCSRFRQSINVCFNVITTLNFRFAWGCNLVMEHSINFLCVKRFRFEF